MLRTRTLGGKLGKNNTSKRTKINNWNTNGNTLKQSAKGSKYKEGSKKYKYFKKYINTPSPV